MAGSISWTTGVIGNQSHTELGPNHNKPSMSSQCWQHRVPPLDQSADLEPKAIRPARSLFKGFWDSCFENGIKIHFHMSSCAMCFLWSYVRTYTNLTCMDPQGTSLRSEYCNPCLAFPGHGSVEINSWHQSQEYHPVNLWKWSIWVGANQGIVSSFEARV